jgi:hypothetical protein
MKIFGLLHITFTRQDPDLKLAAEYTRGLRDAEPRPLDIHEAMRRAERALDGIRDVAFVDGMLAGVEITAATGADSPDGI